MLEDLPSSLFLALKFDKSVSVEVARLMELRSATCSFLKNRRSDWKSLSQMIAETVIVMEEQQKDVSILTDKTKSSELSNETTEWEIGKADVMRKLNWMETNGNFEESMFPTASLMTRCSVLLRNDTTKLRILDLKWMNQKIWTKFDLDQQLHLWRVWQMQNVWSKQTKTWTAMSELGKLEFKTRSGVMKKERENDWNQKFDKESCEKTMQKIKKI